MGKTISDRIVSKISGRDIKTQYISLDEMVDMIDKYYIRFAKTEEDNNKIWKVCKGSFLKNEKLLSDDGMHELKVFTNMHVTIFNLQNHNYAWIDDKNTNIIYKYSAFSWRKFKIAIKEKIYG